ncbi:MAG: hypothetical protein HY682_04735, partial [Chloroflexi bacterium]|nr:hypothetical protein [Chloroflexota bacterium]
MSETRTIRFGVISDRTTMPRWQADAIERLLANDDVVLAVRIAARGTAARGASRNGSSSPLYRLIELGLGRTPADRPVDATSLFAGAATITCSLSPARGGRLVPDSDSIERIAAYELDFVLDFGRATGTWTALPSCRHGVWSFRFGDARDGAGEYAIFWSLYNGDSVVGAELWRSSGPSSEGVVLARGYFRVSGHSYGATAGSLLAGTASFPARVCADLRNGCSTIAQTSSVTARPAPGAPNTLQSVRFLGALAAASGRRVHTAL